MKILDLFEDDAEKRAALLERFFSKTKLEEVERKTGIGPCLVWTGATKNGYGNFRVMGGSEYAHRLAFELHHRRAPREGLDVRHVCDNRPCVLAAHLVEGTRQENVDDAVAQGRHAHGERHGMVRLTDEQVREIRALRTTGLKQREIAERFGVSVSYVSMIETGKLRRSA